MVFLNTAAKIGAGACLTGAAIKIFKPSHLLDVLALAVAGQALVWWMPGFVSRCLQSVRSPSPPPPAPLLPLPLPSASRYSVSRVDNLERVPAANFPAPSYLEDEDDYISKLPNEVLLQIQGQLDPEDAESLRDADRNLRRKLYEADDPFGAAILRFERKVEEGVAVTWQEVRALGILNPQFAPRREEVKLDLRKTPTDANELKEIVRKFPNMIELNLTECPNITNLGLSHVGKLSNLRSLSLSWCNKFTSDGLEHLQDLINLRKLMLRGCYQMDGKGMQYLSNLINLEQLDLGGCLRIPSRGFAPLACLSNLRCLNLAGCSRFNDNAMQHLGRLTNLAELNLWGCRITGAGLQQLVALPLTYLDLRECDIDAAAVTQVATNFKTLKHLNLVMCNITDASLQLVAANLRNLVWLGLGGCTQITDLGVQSLLGLPKLRSVSLTGCTGVTNAARAGLVQGGIDMYVGT